MHEISEIRICRTFYLRPQFQTTPLPTYLLIHGFVFTLWIAFFLAQTTRVAARRTDVPRRLGWAGGVLAAYVGMLQGTFPGIAAHLLAASVMNAPAGLFLSKIIMPETGEPVTKGSLKLEMEKTDSSVIEAAANGAATGVQLAINVAAMLMAFVALIALLNAILGWAGGFVGQPDLSLQLILGTLLRPLAWVMGVPWQDTAYVGSLIGLKTSLNEFVAYAQFASDLGGPLVLSPRSAVILTYALLGFANFSSIAIQIAGIGGLAPERRGEIARFGLRAMIAGNLAAFTSASIAGMLL